MSPSIRRAATERSAVLIFTLGLAAAAPAAVSAKATAYYVDSQHGSDARRGTTPRLAWRTLRRVSSAALHPGDRILLRRGGHWSGELAISANATADSPIRVSAYGRGPRPALTEGDSGACVGLEGDDIRVSGLTVRSCRWAGVAISGRGDAIEHSFIAHNVAGVYVRAGSDGARVMGNQIVDNDRMSVLTRDPRDDDSGAFGVLLNGDRADVAHNTISDSYAFSYDYGHDGSAIEVYGARDSFIHDNTALQNQSFSELGDPRTAGTVFAYNAVFSSLPGSAGLVTRGAGDRFGPVTGTDLYATTIVLTGAASTGVSCGGTCGRLTLRMRDDIVQARRPASVDGAFDESYDLFWGGRPNFRLGPHSRFVNPRLRDPNKGNLHLRRGSPAIDAGVALGYSRDRDGRPVPVRRARHRPVRVDIGAYEYSP